MVFSPEAREITRYFLLVGGGIGCLGYLILLPILYFRLTRKFDTMFPEHDRIIPLASIMGIVVRTGYYSSFIAFKNLINGKRHKIMYDVTNGYDFRRNASRLDIALSYLNMFFAVLALVGAFTFVILTEMFGIDL